MSMHNDDGLSLLEKGKNGLFRVLFGKMGIVLLLLALQLVILFGIFFRFEQFLQDSRDVCPWYGCTMFGTI